MKKILAAGVLSQPWVSFSTISQSDDGIGWDLPTQPFQFGESCSSITTDGTTAIVSSNSSNIAITTNLINFNYQLLPDLFGITDSVYTNNNWIIVGSQFYETAYNVYPAQSEVAQIYLSNSNPYGWHLVWTSSSSYSKFYRIESFNSAPISSSSDLQSVIIACGFADEKTLVQYSLDFGETWTSAAIPENIPAIYSIALFLGESDPVYFWGCRGRFFKSTSLTDSTTWTEILVNANDTIIDIVIDPDNTTVMCGINNIYITFNGENLRSWSYPGYFFNKIEFLPLNPKNRWILYARSLLTQYTTWTSTDLTNWFPINNNLHVSGSTLSF